MAKAKACPFCACTETDLRLSTSDQAGMFVACEGCGAEGPMALATDKAIELWNGRKVKPTLLDAAFVTLLVLVIGLLAWAAVRK